MLKRMSFRASLEALADLAGFVIGGLYAHLSGYERERRSGRAS